MKGTSTSTSKNKWVPHAAGASYSYHKSIYIDTQEKARDACREKNGADLVSITSQDVQDYLLEKFGPFTETHVWIGANDKEMKGHGSGKRVKIGDIQTGKMGNQMEEVSKIVFSLTRIMMVFGKMTTVPRMMCMGTSV